MEQGGGSRAAQKRRKKKVKQHQPQQEVAAREDDPLLEHDGSYSDDDDGALRGGSDRGSEHSSDVPAVASGGGGSGGKRGDSGGGRRGGTPQYIVTVNPDDELERTLLSLPARDVCGDAALDSGVKARQMLQWMVAPVDVNVFYARYWESCPLLVRRASAHYYDGWMCTATNDVNVFYARYWESCPLLVRRASARFYDGWMSTADVRACIAQQALRYGSDLDVTNFVEGRRVTLNPPAPEGEEGGAAVDEGFVWGSFERGCSLRMPCPQKYCDKVHALLASLEEEWGCMVGANVYLTPPGHQGFAPHYDDIEAFLLQIEGSKRWKVYAPAGAETSLPRTSSENLTPEQVQELGEPVIDAVLEPGDLLYFPRGWVHQAVTVAGGPASLHLTVSCYQGNCWADMLETLVPMALEAAGRRHLALRQGLPRDYLQYVGVAAGEGDADARRQAFVAAAKGKMKLVMAEAMEAIDDAADLMGRRFISDRLPPVLHEDEEAVSVLQLPTPRWTGLSRVRCLRRGIARLVVEDGMAHRASSWKTAWRCLRRGIARLIVEDGMAVVYHCMDNARVHHGNPLRPLEFELDDALAIETLLAAYPRAVAIKDLPHPPAEDLDDKLEIAKALYAEGFLAFEGDEEEAGEGGDEAE
ncbi:cupin superfamily protein-domain-containing protein [Tribonema minus]|uniref:Bifunctional lysine-specific demethylase and histidyl-hydroxylase n=1 Tax=Tribonema minus TaxID=303371 RepID=A0A835Z731_9STRA|nr:cupin superfamily protein-domain-containing protein [Tribonema minus]